MIQKAKRKFASQTLSKKAKFVVFGLKKASMATLVSDQSDAKCAVFFFSFKLAPFEKEPLCLCVSSMD